MPIDTLAMDFEFCLYYDIICSVMNISERQRTINTRNLTTEFYNKKITGR